MIFLRVAAVITAMLLVSPVALAADMLRLSVQSVSIAHDPRDASQPQIVVRLREPSAREFSDFTRDHIQQYIVVMVDDKAVSPPMRILQELTGGFLICPVRSFADAQTILSELTGGTSVLSVTIFGQI